MYICRPSSFLTEMLRHMVQDRFAGMSMSEHNVKLQERLRLRQMNGWGSLGTWYSQIRSLDVPGPSCGAWYSMRVAATWVNQILTQSPATLPGVLSSLRNSASYSPPSPVHPLTNIEPHVAPSRFPEIFPRKDGVVLLFFLYANRPWVVRRRWWDRDFPSWTRSFSIQISM